MVPLFNFCQLLVIVAVIALTQARCGEKYQLAKGQEVTVENVGGGRRNKCLNKFTCKDGKYSCDIVVKCNQFSFRSNSWRGGCGKNFLNVKDGSERYGKYCDGTGAPNLVIPNAKNVRLFAKGKKYNFKCQVSALGDDTVGPSPTTSPGGGGTTADCCARYNPTNIRIVGGQPVATGEIPWQVALKSKTTSQQFCGGTLISASWVLTAKHCVEDAKARRIKVSLGDHHIDHSDGETDHAVSKIVLAKGKNSDIALLKLTTPATFSDRIRPACLPTSYASDSFEGKSLWVTGWGTTSQGGGGSLSKDLLKVFVPVVSNQQCAANYRPDGATVTDKEICAAGTGKDACQGDSGGPAVWADGPERRAFIVGVVSWGIGCANQGYPGVYVRVTSYLDWIKSTTAGDTVCSA